MKYIDAHCHILSDAQMRDAAACGMGRFIVNATQPSDWNKVIELAQRGDVFGAIGVHPWFIANLAHDWDVDLIEILTANPNLMVGEIGLDKNHDDTDAQLSLFRRQIQIAHNLGRVANIHVVGTWGKMMDVLRGTDLPPIMVFHAFSGAPELIPELVKMNAFLSFGSAVCDTRRAQLRLSVAAVPESRILVESDAPDGAAPCTIPDTVSEIARIRGVAPERMAEIIYKNTMRILNEQQI